MLGAIALVMLVAVVFAVTLPLFYEVTLTVLAMAGWSSLRTNGRVLRIGYHVNALSDKAEYGVAAAVLLLITLPIYTHYSQLVPFFRALHEHQRGADVEMGDAAAAAAAEHETLTHILVFHLLPSVWINAGMLVNFFAAAVRGPGRPDGYLEGSWCKTCRIYRPPGSHHCSSCNTCILDMDHHCPFTAGCIGRRNIRFFFWFITFSLFACLYALWLTFHPFVHCRAIESAGDEAQHPEHLLCQSELGSKARLFYLAVAAAVVVSAFWILMVALAATGRSMRSFMGGGRKSSSSDIQRRGLLDNLRGRLGPVKWWPIYLLPIPQLYDLVPFVEAKGKA